MTARENEEELAELRRDAEASQRRYAQVLGEIKAKKAQLGEAMTALAAMGCESLADADAQIEGLQKDLDDRLTEIRRLLA